MAVVINEAGNSQNAPLDIPACCGTQQAEETKWFRDWTISLGVVLSVIIVAETIVFILTCILCYIYLKKQLLSMNLFHVHVLKGVFMFLFFFVKYILV